MTHGVTIGKFCPPHRGHKHLIDSAKTQVDEFTVLVCDRDDHSIPAELRAAWLREIHPGANIMVIDDCVPDDDSKGWADYTIRILGFRPDVVFTSEVYGDSYAAHMGAKHVMVDRNRVVVPISATQIRATPLKHWDYLEPCVRAHFAKRVAVVGAECTGKTTLARSLAAHFSTSWVPEFGRTYSEAKLLSRDADRWQTSEFVFIASEQNRIEDALARTCNKILICDTDSFSTNLWHERYLDRLSSEVEALAHGRKYDLYLLAAADFPFIPDGLSDGAQIRQAMQERFFEELGRRTKQFEVLVGDFDMRLAAAAKACDRILTQP
jgi:HTH-type transcriptional regulator, transcriptional repressor of NAD biosynthesis genes